MKDILQILNPIHLLTCDEWMKIADIVRVNSHPFAIEHTDHIGTVLKFEQLQSRFEELTRGKFVVKQCTEDCDCRNINQCKHLGENEWEPALLKKEMFVSEVDKPSFYNAWLFNKSSLPYLKKAGELTLKQIRECEEYEIKNTEAQSKVWLTHKSEKMLDEIYYNTPMWEWLKKIEGNGEWNWTENFLKELLK